MSEFSKVRPGHLKRQAWVYVRKAVTIPDREVDRRRPFRQLVAEVARLLVDPGCHRAGRDAR
jgi:hypothetical protein